MAIADDTASPVLRRGLLWLAAITIAGIGVELAADRHWTQPVQLVAWMALGAIALALFLVAVNPTRPKLWLARLLVIIVMLSAVWGIWEHVYANYDAGGLDFEYTNTWDGLAESTRWWLAVTKTVGPSPPLAPGALAQASLAVLIATLRHPMLHKTP